jgi:hypothetical protein
MVVSIVTMMENPTQAVASPSINGELVMGSKEIEKHGEVSIAPSSDEMPYSTTEADPSRPNHQVNTSRNQEAMTNISDEFVNIEENFRTMVIDHESDTSLLVEGQAHIHHEQDNEYDLDGENDEESSDEEPLKLFVGQVRSIYNGLYERQHCWFYRIDYYYVQQLYTCHSHFLLLFLQHNLFPRSLETSTKRIFSLYLNHSARSKTFLSYEIDIQVCIEVVLSLLTGPLRTAKMPRQRYMTNSYSLEEGCIFKSNLRNHTGQVSIQVSTFSDF